MFLLALLFLVVAIMSGTMVGVGGSFASISQVLFILFLTLFVVSLVWENNEMIHHKHHRRHR